MIGLALCVSVVYIIGFMLVHQKDAKTLDETGYWGESCYDPQTMSSSLLFDWQQHYAEKVCMAPNYKNRNKNVHNSSSDFEDILFANSFEPITDADYSLILGMNAEEAFSYANQRAKDKDLPQSLLEQYEEEAKKDAQSARESFNEEI